MQLLVAGKVGLIRVYREALFYPIDLINPTNVHEFHPNGVAVNQVQVCNNLAQSGPLQANNRRCVEWGVQICFGKAVIRIVQRWCVFPACPHRIRPCKKMSALAVIFNKVDHFEFLGYLVRKGPIFRHLLGKTILLIMRLGKIHPLKKRAPTGLKRVGILEVLLVKLIDECEVCCS